MTKIKVHSWTESENPKISNDSAKRFGIGFMQKKQLSEQLSLNGGLGYESLSRDYDATERVNDDEDAAKAMPS